MRSIDEAENNGGSWLTEKNLTDFDAVIDFTTPHAVVPNIEACLRVKKATVAGTTGWYGETQGVRSDVEKLEPASSLARTFPVV